jgi:hypothetical protein
MGRIHPIIIWQMEKPKKHVTMVWEGVLSTSMHDWDVKLGMSIGRMEISEKVARDHKQQGFFIDETGDGNHSKFKTVKRHDLTKRSL